MDEKTGSFDPHDSGRAHGYQLPERIRGIAAGLQVVDIGGIAHFWCAETGCLVNAEAVSDKISLDDWRKNR